MAGKHKTQTAMLQAFFLKRLGVWVPLPEILALGCAQYSARVHELRKLGFRIENKTARVGNQRHSWFRLVGVMPAPATRQTMDQRPAIVDSPANCSATFTQDRGIPTDE